MRQLISLSLRLLDSTLGAWIWRRGGAGGTMPCSCLSLHIMDQNFCPRPLHETTRSFQLQGRQDWVYYLILKCHFPNVINGLKYDGTTWVVDQESHWCRLLFILVSSFMFSHESPVQRPMLAHFEDICPVKPRNMTMSDLSITRAQFSRIWFALDVADC